MARTLEQAIRMGATRAVALCRCFGGVLDFQLGRIPEAEAKLREAVELYRRVGSASGEALSLQRLGVVLTASGRLDEGLRVLVDGVVPAERAVMRSHCLTRLYAAMARNRLAAGDVSHAEACLRLGSERAERHGECVTCGALLLPEAVRVALAAGRPDDAAAHAAELEGFAARFDSRAWRAIAAQARGRVHAAAGRTTEAVQAFTTARDAYLAAENRYEAARCSRGAGLAAEASEAFAALGAPGVED